MTGTRPTVAIIGAGISGLGFAVRLQRAGHRFTIFEKAEDIGGTWRENRYPGLTCDVPAFVYTYSHARSFAARRLLTGGDAILDYLRGVFEHHDLGAHTRFGSEVTGARWDGSCWHLDGTAGELGTYEVVVHATGFLHHPRLPDIPGRGDFGGPAFHSARWPDPATLPGGGPTGLEGLRVGVIGTGSTGVQLTTALAESSTVSLFQRTPQWIFPFPDVTVPSTLRRLLARRPAAAEWVIERTERFGDWFVGGAARGRRLPRWVFTLGCRMSLARVRDRELRRRLRPVDAPMCKRPVMSAGFYRAVQKPGVRVVDAGIERLTEVGVRTVDGVEHPLDVLVFATGFDAHAYMRPMHVVGREGRRLDEAWGQGPVAYRTMALHGFPNMFLVLGPHAPLLSVAIHHTVERQADYVCQLVDLLAHSDLASVEPTAEATEEWLREIEVGLGGTVWDGSCRSWYVGEKGLAIMWPFDRDRWLETLRTPVLGDYTIRADQRPGEPVPA